MPEPRGRPAGICVPYRGVTAADAVRHGVEAAALGYEAVWVSELAGYDAVAVAAAIASGAPGVRVGTAVVPSTTRSPALLAMAAATLASLAPAGAILGLGASSPAITAGWHGVPGEKPLTAMRDVLEILAAALGGEPTDYEGELARSHGFKLDTPPPARPSVYLGALGPKMLALAHERADGTILNFAPRSQLAELAREARGPRGAEHEVVLMVRCGLDGGDAERRFRRELASYLRVAPYRRWLERLGHADAVAAAAAHETLDERAAALPDALVDDVAVLGGGAESLQALEEIRDAGVTPLVVPVAPPGDGGAFAAVAEALARGTPESP